MPVLRNLIKDFEKTKEYPHFLINLPHTYFEENMIHALAINRMKDIEACIEALEAFLPYVDNWAVCDCLAPKVLCKNRTLFLIHIKKWLNDSRPFVARFGIGMLMKYYLDDDFDSKFLKWVASRQSEDYYVNMMIAWYFATALAKQNKASIPYLEKKKLPIQAHNKTIQKAIESYRITPEQKDYLRTLKL